MQYLRDPGVAKEELARELARRDKIKEDLIGIFSAVEPCLSYSVRGDHQSKHVKLVLEMRKCTHFYHYYQHSQFGLLHVRLQSWFPFTVDICLNGREWLARELDAAHIDYTRRDNCFMSLGDPLAAQKLLDEQLRTDWSARLDELLAQAHPLGAELGKPIGQRYYWSATQSEFATDGAGKSQGEQRRCDGASPTFQRRSKPGAGEPSGRELCASSSAKTDAEAATAILTLNSFFTPHPATVNPKKGDPTV